MKHTQFAVAVHLMAGMGCRSGRPVTSGSLAGSVNTNASFVRRVMAKLSAAGLVGTAKGKAGCCWLARDAAGISLLDIYRAVNPPLACENHSHPVQPDCQVSVHIKGAIGKALGKAQDAFEERLSEITLAEVIADLAAK